MQAVQGVFQNKGRKIFKFLKRAKAAQLRRWEIGIELGVAVGPWIRPDTPEPDHEPSVSQYCCSDKNLQHSLDDSN